MPAPYLRVAGGPRPAPYRASVQWERRYARLLAAFDAVAITVAAVLAFFVRFGERTPASPLYLLITVLLPGVWVASMALGRAYESRFLGAGSEEFRRIVNAAACVIAGVAVVSYATKTQITRGYVLLALPLATVLAVAGRSVGRAILHRLRREGRCQHRVLVVGGAASAADLVELARRDPTIGWRIVGVCLNRATGPRRSDLPEGGGPDVRGAPVVGTFDTVQEAIRETAATTVAVCPELEGVGLRRLMWSLEGSDVHVLVGSAITDVTGPRITIRPVAGLPLLHVEEPELTGARRVLKAGVDRVVAFVAIVLLAPLLVLIALAVRLTSPGPALFTQTRVGMHGRLFRMYKFRSMEVDAE